MPKENYFQSIVIKQLRKQGGIGAKWSSQFKVGVPDLVLGVPEIGICLMEMKRVLLNASATKFSRKIEATELQQRILAEYATTGPAMIGVVVYSGPGKWDLVLVPPYTKKLSSSEYSGHHGSSELPPKYPSTRYVKGSGLNVTGVIEDYISAFGATYNTSKDIQQ